MTVPAAGGLTGTELAGGVDDDLDAIGFDTEFLDSDLAGDGVDALTHLGPAVSDLDRAVGVEPHGRTADLVGAVSETGVLQTEPHADGIPGSDRRIPCRFHGVETGSGTEAAVVHDLAGPPHHAGLDDIATTDLPPRDAGHLGEPIHHALHRELGLVGAETAKRTAHRVVGAHRDGVDVDCLGDVRPACVTGGPLQHLHAHRGVRTRVADHVGPDGEELAVGVTADLVLHPNRMAFCVNEKRLLTRERRLHRAAEQPGSQRRLALIRHVLFAAERTAVRDEFDGDLVGRYVEHAGDVIAVIPHALATGIDVQRFRRPVGADGRTASVDSGSRNAWSMRWVWKVSRATWPIGLAPRRHRGVRGPAELIAWEGPDGIFLGQRRCRIGERP